MFIYRRNRPALRSVESLNLFLAPICQQQTAAFSLTSNTVCYFSFSASPKDGFNNESLLLHTHLVPVDSPPIGLSISTKWQNTRSAEDCRVSTWVHGKWNTVYHLVCARHFWAAVHFSFLMLKNYFPPTRFLAKPGAWAALARALKKKRKKTAADRDKNNYSSICLPRDTHPSRPTPFLYELLHFLSPAHTIRPFTIMTLLSSVGSHELRFQCAGCKQK